MNEEVSSSNKMHLHLEQLPNLPVDQTNPSDEEYLKSCTHIIERKKLPKYAKDSRAIRKEFLGLPLNHIEKLDIPGAATKNRYRMIWPNPHSRVVLNAYEQTEDPSSTYINANYMRGYQGEPKAFIATQGPLPDTVSDFWRMVWQERSPCIVMMTRWEEDGKIKCERYLPEKSEVYGSIRVTVHSTHSQDDGSTVHDLILMHPSDNAQGSEYRHVKHFWFTSLPDHKAPSAAAVSFVNFVKDVELERTKCRRLAADGSAVGPVVVHCSAGIGRTGCFIATCIGMRQMEAENAVDILRIVSGMRLDRGGMIQTMEQYEFLHIALAHFAKGLPEETPLDSAAAVAGDAGNVAEERSSTQKSEKSRLKKIGDIFRIQSH